MYQYATLAHTSYEQITECFNLAFSDYTLPVAMRAEQLRQYFEMCGVERDLSCGAFINGQLVGFIFYVSGIYQGQRTVFDVGTGVIPVHRGKQVCSHLFAFAEERLAQVVDNSYLEVLQQNTRAIRLYKRHGFAIKREYVVLRSSGMAAQDEIFSVKEKDFSQFDLRTVEHCISPQPSFEHCTDVLRKNPHLYGVRYWEREEQISAFCIFRRQNGAIVQLGYQDLSDLRRIVQGIQAEYSDVTVKNIDGTYSQLLDMLLSLGFREAARQFEMCKRLIPVD